MHIFIDTHLNDIVIILWKDGKIIKKEILRNQKEHSRVIMPNLKTVLDNLIPDSIIVVNGPGSFTSVRLGVTIAKTLAYSWNIPIRVISSLECLAISIDNDNKFVAFNDLNGYYVGNFNNNMEQLRDYNYFSNKDFEELKKENNVVTNVSLDYNKIIEFALKKDSINPHKVNPIYIKKLDVEK